MAEPTTAQNVSPAANATDTATVTNPNAGSESTQPTNAAQVDSSSVEDKGNSAVSDEQNGAESADGVRQRPGRAERRISELTSKVSELTQKLEQTSQLSTKLQASPVDPSQVNLPDYSQMAEITPDQIKKDIITAASQIVDLKMQTTANALEEKLSWRQATEKSAQAIDSALKKYPVLNPESETYDQTLDQEISASYTEILQKDPSYSFDKFIKPMERFLESSNTTADANDSGSSSNRGTSANRSGAQSRATKQFADLQTADEMETWIKAHPNQVA